MSSCLITGGTGFVGGHLAEACAARRRRDGTEESQPLPSRHIDGYTQSKVEAEALALDYQRRHDVPVVVLRPGFVYGPRDRTVLPRLAENLRKGLVRYLGSGEQ